jgi:hypothetical protein
MEMIPNIIRTSDVEGLIIPRKLVLKVDELMTPRELLAATEYPEPKMILPSEFPDFNSILCRKESVRRLELLPIKDPEEYDRYHAQPRQLLLDAVKGYLGPDSMACATNRYPYWLPKDLDQYLVWTKGDVTDRDLTRFIAKVIHLKKTPIEELILFERPTKTSMKLLRGTFSEYRHIHLWNRLAIDKNNS